MIKRVCTGLSGNKNITWLNNGAQVSGFCRAIQFDTWINNALVNVIGSRDLFVIPSAEAFLC